MASTENLGAYHDLFFKLGGIDKTADEYTTMSDSKDVDNVKDVYAAWVAKYINVDEKNPEGNLPSESAAADTYFKNEGDEIAKMPDGPEKEQRKQKYSHDCTELKLKEVTLEINGKDILRTYDPTLFENESAAMAALSYEYYKNHPEEGKKEDEPLKEDDTLNVSDTDDKTPTPENENKDWIAEEEKFWKEGYCEPKGYEYVRNPEQKEGIEFDIYKNDEDRKNKSPSAHFHYKSQNSVVVTGKDGGVPDYEDILRLAQDAKRMGKSVNFEHIKTPEFAAKLKLACEELGVKYVNAPEGKIDAQSFENQLSPEAKAKLAAYNQGSEPQAPEPKVEPKEYDVYAKEMAERAAKGDKEVDLAGLEGAEAAKALAAAKMAGLGVKNAPEYVDYNGGKIVEGADGKQKFEKSEMSEALKDLPELAQGKLGEHNREFRQKQIEEVRKNLNKKPDELMARAAEEGRRFAFSHENKEYSGTGQNTADAAKNRQKAMKQYWDNKKQND